MGIVAGLLCSGPALFAQEDPFAFDLSEETSQERQWRVSGFFESRNQRFIEQDAFLSTRQRGQLELKYASKSDKWRFFTSAYGEYDQATEDYRSPFRGEVLEAYGVFDGPSTDITLGRQRIPWGTADGRSTIDRVNAVDFRDPIGNARTSARRPSWVARIEHTTSIGVFEGVWLPIGRDRRIPEQGSPWEIDFLSSLRSADDAGTLNLNIEDPKVHEGGFRFLQFGEGFDWSFAVFNGLSDFPLLSLQSPDLVRLTPARFTTVNLSAAIGQTKSTWRGEIAYTPDFPLGLGQTTDLSQIIVGWDRTFLLDLYVNVQLFFDRFGNVDDTYGGTFAITNSFFDDATEAGVRGQVANEGQYAIETFADYEFNDAITLTARVFLFGGQIGSDLGEFRENDFAELTLRYAF